MRRDIAVSLQAPELDVADYIGRILERFRNPAIVHKLSQIAWDGSQKLQFRLLETASEALAAGRPVDRLAVGVAAWIRFVVRQTRAGAAITDPLAEVLAAAACGCSDGAGDVDRFLALSEVFPGDLAADPRFRSAVVGAYLGLAADPEAVLGL